VLECLTLNGDGSCSLVVHLQAKFVPAQASKRARVDIQVRAGKDGAGPKIGYAVRELIRAAYLRPLCRADGGGLTLIRVAGRKAQTACR
jgi:putative ATP-dependent endonuclease of the OLD family